MWRIEFVLGMVGTLVIAFGLDRWIQSIRETGLVNFQMGPYLGVAIGANFLMGAILLLLAWLVNFSGRRSLFVSLIYTLVGILLTLLPLMLTRVPVVFDFFTAPAFRPLRLTLLYSAPTSRLYYASGFIAALGVLGLYLGRGDP